MNSFTVFVLIFAVFSAVASALPSSNQVETKNMTSLTLMDIENSARDPTPPDMSSEVDTAEIGDRFRRVTCDILSVNTKWGSLNHSACAARCLAKRKGYRGGYCKDGVCHCRR